MKIPTAFTGLQYCQYGNALHASERRRILESILLYITTDYRPIISVCHVVVEGSSQLVLGRNLTHNFDISHINKNAAIIPTSLHKSINMVDYNIHSSLPLSRF